MHNLILSLSAIEHEWHLAVLFLALVASPRCLPFTRRGSTAASYAPVVRGGDIGEGGEDGSSALLLKREERKQDG